MAQALETASRLFSGQGFRGTSMREIAAESGLSVGSLYHHFPSKEAIFQRLLERHFERLGDPDLLLNKVFAAARFPDDLPEMARGVAQVVEENLPAIVLTYVDLIEFRGEHVRAYYEGLAGRFRDAYGEALARRKAAGEIGDVDPLVAVMVAVQWFFYFFTVEKGFGVPMHFGMSAQEAVAEFIRLLRYGLLPRAGPPG